MKILFFTNSLEIYSEVWLRRHIEMLKQDLCVIVCLNSKDQFYGKIPIVNLNPAMSIWYRIKSKFKSISDKEKSLYSSLRLALSIKKYKPDLIFVEYMTNAVKFKEILIKSSLPILIHCHGYDITWNLCTHEKPEEEYFERTYLSNALQISRQSYVIANSKYTYNNLLRVGFLEDRIFLKYLGVKTDVEFRKLSNPDEFNIVFIGRLVDCKGPDLLIQAFDEACKMGMKANLIIAGDGPLLVTCQLLRARSICTKSIHLLGQVDESHVRLLLQKAHVFSTHNTSGCLSHQTESFGVSIIEAMSYEVPVVSSKSGGIPEIIIHRQTGLLFEPGNVIQHAESLVELYNNSDLRIQMGRNARSHVVENFSIKEEYEKFNEIFKMIIS